MAAVPEGLVARALGRLGVDSDALSEAVRRAREEGTE
jgi:ClpA/ClpB-like protein